MVLILRSITVHISAMQCYMYNAIPSIGLHVNEHCFLAPYVYQLVATETGDRSTRKLRNYSDMIWPEIGNKLGTRLVERMQLCTGV